MLPTQIWALLYSIETSHSRSLGSWTSPISAQLPLLTAPKIIVYTNYSRYSLIFQNVILEKLQEVIEEKVTASVSEADKELQMLPLLELRKGSNLYMYALVIHESRLSSVNFKLLAVSFTNLEMELIKNLNNLKVSELLPLYSQF